MLAPDLILVFFGAQVVPPNLAVASGAVCPLDGGHVLPKRRRSPVCSAVVQLAR